MNKVEDAMKLKMNEIDDKQSLQRELIMHNGKAYENEVRKIFMYIEKMKISKEDIMSTQLAQKTLVSEPLDEVQNREVTEVESLKLELAKHGVMMSNDALKRGIVLPNREQRFTVKGSNPEYP